MKSDILSYQDNPISEKLIKMKLDLFRYFLFLFFIFYPYQNPYAQIITTFAGIGISGNSGTGGPANAAQLDRPLGITTDNLGNVYIADNRNHQIKKVSTSGVISVVAGTGIAGFSGDGGLATSAKLFFPKSISVDQFNNVYFSDQDGEKLRKINASGIISTIMGNPPGYSGDGGPLSLAQFDHISAPVFDAIGNMFIIDAFNYVIRKVNTAGIVSTIAGTAGVGGFSGDGGPAINAQFLGIFNLVLDNVGNIYVSTNNRIRKIDLVGNINTLVGNAPFGFSGDGGPAALAAVNVISGVALDNSGNIYFGDFYSNRIRMINAAGIINTVVGNGINGYTGDGGPATAAQVGEIVTITFDAANNLYFSIQNYPSVRKVSNCLAAVISQQPNDVSLCNSGNATFSTMATNLTGYQWQEKVGAVWNNIVNNAMYAGSNTNTLNITGATTLMNAFQYRCVLTNVCGNAYTAAATLAVSTPTAPTIIIATATNVICQGTATTFTATTTSGGILPVYQWKKNGINVGANTNTYSNSTLVNGDVISCSLMSSASCLTTVSANSNEIIMTVNSPIAATVTINASMTNICSGTTVNFNASNTNGGSMPSYQWKKNGVNVGINSPLYSTNSLINGDVISCVLTSSKSCLTSNTVNSNNVTMIVNPLFLPTINIIASANNVCTAVPITFNATTTNSGTSQMYQWKKNGLNVGTNISNYTDNTLTSLDNISCVLSVGGGCFSANTITSNIIQSTILSPALPNVNISTAKTAICKGSLINFSSVANNITAITTFQWLKNGINVGTNSSIYTDSTITNGDAIQLKITTTNNNNCIAVTSILSNIILMTVLENPTVTLDQSNTICNGGTKLLDAGNFVSYQWSNGSLQRIINITELGIYYVSVKDNSGCIGSDTAKITTTLPKPSNFLPIDTFICTYGSVLIIAKSGYKKYLWNNLSTQPTLNVSQPGQYNLTVTDNNNCKAEEKILVIKKEGCIKGFYIPTAFTPNNDNKNDLFKPLIFGNLLKYKFIIYNRYGQPLFETTDINSGWNGKLKGDIVNTNGYIWICNYQLEGEKEVTKKGTVLMIK